MKDNISPENNTNTSEQTNEAISTNENEAVRTKKGFDFLRELCSFNADFNAREPRPNPITNRVQYIMHQLEAFGVPYEVDMFRADGIWNQEMRDDHNKFINLYIRITGLDQTKTVIFSSHHDVANKASENAEDNGASVCNLLDLAIQLHGEQPPCNVVISFTDGEEINGMQLGQVFQGQVCTISPYNGGSNRMATKIKAGDFGNVVYIYHLELTANGTHYWYSFQYQPNAPVNPAANHMKQLYPSAKRVKTPYSDSIPMEMHLLPSVCIGSLIKSELEVVKLGKGCKTWAVCHSEKDLFESFAVEADMDAFVLFMRSLL